MSIIFPLISGIYCLLAVATLLNILTPELLCGTPEFVATCQTYEGGFGNASFPEWAFGTGKYVSSIRRLHKSTSRFLSILTRK